MSKLSLYNQLARPFTLLPPLRLGAGVDQERARPHRIHDLVWRQPPHAGPGSRQQGRHTAHLDGRHSGAPPKLISLPSGSA